MHVIESHRRARAMHPKFPWSSWSNSALYSRPWEHRVETRPDALLLFFRYGTGVGRGSTGRVLVCFVFADGASRASLSCTPRGEMRYKS